MRIVPALLTLAAAILPAAAQTPAWDTSGNGLLNGTYYFREVAYVTANYAGDLQEAIALYGQITFSGTGTYTISAVGLEWGGTPGSFTTSGTYSVSAAGYGYLSHPLSSGDYVVGLVSNGIFIGSSTESGFNDLFVAAKLPSPQGTVASLKGAYTLAYMNFPSVYQDYTYDALWQMSPDGAGNLGTVSLKAYTATNGTSVITQSISGVKYIFSNGAANMQFPNSQTAAIAGNEYLYLSQDGNFVFGGSPNGFDFFVGVRTPASTGATGLNGLYYQAGLDVNASTIASGYATLDSYYGSLNASGGSIVAHQRFLSAFASAGIDYTYADTYSVAANGTYTDTAYSTQYVVGSGSGIRIGLGIGPYLGIAAALPAPSLSGSGVYLNPTGISNAASSAPFTASIAPGELITLYGSNLAADTAVATSTPFPTTLAGVQVTINGTLAPIYYVSPGQASVIVPYSATAPVAQIQVTNNGVASNAVTVYSASTAPGVFTNPVGGLGYAAALHGDGTVVTAADPAAAGEYISVFVTGLGPVSPTIADGAAGPADPLSYTSNTIAANIDGTTATVSYAGLAPYFAGLYQINVQVPTGTASGDVSLDISGPDTYTTEALLPVGTATAALAVAGSRRPLALRATPRTIPPRTGLSPAWRVAPPDPGGSPRALTLPASRE